MHDTDATPTPTLAHEDDSDVDLDLEFDLPEGYEAPVAHIRANVCPENCY